jgi:hypothetical protein
MLEIRDGRLALGVAKGLEVGDWRLETGDGIGVTGNWELVIGVGVGAQLAMRIALMAKPNTEKRIM